MSRLEAGLNRQELFLQRPASVRRDLGASLPLCLAVGLDDLVGGSRVAREVLCARKKEKEEKIKIWSLAARYCLPGAGAAQNVR